VAVKNTILPAVATVDRLWPGLLVCGLIALAAQFLADQYGAPAMLMALLLGLSLHFLVEDGERSRPGVEFSAKVILRVGVALLGARISFADFAELGLGCWRWSLSRCWGP